MQGPHGYRIFDSWYFFLISNFLITFSRKAWRIMDLQMGRDKLKELKWRRFMFPLCLYCSEFVTLGSAKSLRNKIWRLKFCRRNKYQRSLNKYLVRIAILTLCVRVLDSFPTDRTLLRKYQYYSTQSSTQLNQDTNFIKNQYLIGILIEAFERFSTFMNLTLLLNSKINYNWFYRLLIPSFCNPIGQHNKQYI